MRDLARGGNDRLTGRADGSAEIVGDAYVIRDGARGGNDRITSVGESTALIGDANVLGAVDDDDFIEAASVGILAQFQASGGNDILIDGDIGTLLLGDAYEMGVRSRGGNDVLKGGGGDDIIVGDALLMNAYFPEPTVFAVEEPGISIGGSDVLFGGTGNDKLYGDALEFEEGAEHGRDRFVFEADSGQDGIADFGRGQDLIDLSRLGVADFADLSIVEDEGTSTIDLGGGNLVRVIGVTGLDASDFIFA
jgi:Ca2+-binding RTX toxin-like protein